MLGGEDSTSSPDRRYSAVIEIKKGNRLYEEYLNLKYLKSRKGLSKTYFYDMNKAIRITKSRAYKILNELTASERIGDVYIVWVVKDERSNVKVTGVYDVTISN